MFNDETKKMLKEMYKANQEKDDMLIVVIVKVGHRRDVYKGN